MNTKEIQRYFFSGEEIVLTARAHLVVLTKPAIGPLSAIVLVSGYPNSATGLLLIAAFAMFFWEAMQWYYDCYILTTKRILSTAGIFHKKIASLPLSKITDLTYDRTLTGRILGYGSLGLESAGQIQGLERIEFLPDSDQFYRVLMSLALGDIDEPLEVQSDGT